MTNSGAVVVLGSINVDLVIRSERLPQPGETVLGGDFFRTNGGKGANQAVAAARASSSPVTFLAAIGDDDFGENYRVDLERENLNLSHLKVSSEPTGTALILVDANAENLISVASGANASLTPEDITNAFAALNPSGGVFLACLESPLETVRQGLRLAKRHGLRTILNPAPATLEICHSEWFADIDVLTPNETELALLSGHAVISATDRQQAANTLFDQGLSTLVLTRGRSGAELYRAGSTEAEHFPAPVVEAVDTTGAGDAFNGTLAATWSKGTSLSDAIRLAIRAASESVTKLGAQ